MKGKEKLPSMEENPGEHVADALCWLRRESGLTQKELARRTRELRKREPSRKSVLETQISDFERGRTKPSHDALVAILTAVSLNGRCDFGKYQEALDHVRGLGGEAAAESLGAAATLVQLESEMAVVQAELAQFRDFRKHAERVLAWAKELDRNGRGGSNSRGMVKDALASVDYVFGDRR